MTIPRLTRTLAALALVIPAFASAAVVNVHQTVDLTTLDLSGHLLYQEYDAPVTLAVGDTLHLTYDFAGDQTLKMFNPLDIFGWLGARDRGCTAFQATGSLQFIDARGPVRSVTKTDSPECLQFGLTFDSSEFTSGRGPIEFSGLDFVMTVDAYNNLDTRDYTGPLLFLYASRYQIGHLGSVDVPEPASIGLIGLGMAALLARRKRKTA